MKPHGLRGLKKEESTIDTTLSQGRKEHWVISVAGFNIHITFNQSCVLIICLFVWLVPNYLHIRMERSN